MLSRKNLHEMFEYRDGKLYNRYTRNPMALKGEIVGSKHHSGYYQVQIKRQLYMVHRLIWIMFNGDIPYKMEIDHINHVRDDNRLNNLRLVTSKENRRNQKLAARNTSGTIGVYFNKNRGKWQGQIKVDGKNIHLGCFINKEDAIAARKHAEKIYNFHKNHGGK